MIVRGKLRLAPNPTTEVVLCFKVDAIETVEVILNGVTYTENGNPGVNYGWVKFHITGLAPGTAYPYTRNGVAAPYPVRTLRGDGALKILYFCCIDMNNDVHAMHAAIARENPDIIFINGDKYYCGSALTRDGVTCTGADVNIAATANIQNYLNSNELVERKPAFIKAYEYCAVEESWDDHEKATDNSSPTGLADFQAALPGATQGDLDAMHATSKAAWSVARFGMQASPVTDATNPFYNVYDTPLLRVCVTDHMNDRSPVGATDNAAKLMMAPLQEARLISDINTAPYFAVWLSSKEFFHVAVNTDTFRFYSTQLKRVAWETRFKAWTSLGGDSHLGNIQYAKAGWNGPGSPGLVQLVTSPAGMPLNESQGEELYELDHAWWKRGTFDFPCDRDWSRPYGVIEIIPGATPADHRMITAFGDALEEENNGRVFEFTFELGNSVPFELRDPTTTGGAAAGGSAGLTAGSAVVGSGGASAGGAAGVAAPASIAAGGGGSAGGLAALNSDVVVVIDPRYQITATNDNGPRSKTCWYKDPEGRIPLCFNFMPELLFNEDVFSSEIEITLLQGEDNNKSITLDGDPIHLRGRVCLWMRFGLANVSYAYECKIVTTLGRMLSLTIVVPVREIA